MALTADLISYFTGIATNHTAINHTADEQHFIHGWLEDIINKTPSTLNYPMLILEPYDWRIMGNDSNAELKWTTGISIWKNCSDVNQDMAERQGLLDECEQIILEIIARMRLDRDEPGMGVPFKYMLLQQFELEGIQAGQHSLHDRVGWRAILAANKPQLMAVDNSIWTDL